MNQQTTYQRWAWGSLVGISAIILLMMTLKPVANNETPTLNLQPFFFKQWAFDCLMNGDTCPYYVDAIIYLMIDVVGNIVVFIPLGVGLAGLMYTTFPRKIIWLAILGGLLLSLTIELIQLTIPSRTTDVDDVLLNTLGTAIGVAGIIFLQRMSRRYE